jgi:hypothetical protein
VFFGVGSLTILNKIKEDLKNLIDKLKGFFDFNNIGNLDIEENS